MTDPDHPEGDSEAAGPVTVFVPRDLSEQVVAESLLKEAGIPFESRYDNVQNLIGWGQVGGTNLLTGPVQIEVPPEFAAEARQLFAGGVALEAGEEPGLELPIEPEPAEVPEDPRVVTLRRSAIASLLFSVFGFGTYFAALGFVFGMRALAIPSRGLPNPWRVLAVVGALGGLVGLWARVSGVG